MIEKPSHKTLVRRPSPIQRQVSKYRPQAGNASGRPMGRPHKHHSASVRQHTP